ncbi:MAG: TetR/AcrR family transcriptional regulator [Actinomycetota bacterium]
MADTAPDVNRRSKGEQTRHRILAEARRVLVAEGYDAVVLRAVADCVGIKLGNLQYYFPTRDDLLLAVMTHEAATDIEDIRAVSDEQRAPFDVLTNVVDVLVTKWRSDSGTVLATLGFMRMHKPDFEAAYRTIYAAFYEEIEQAIERVAPSLPADEYRRRARLLTALIDGASMQVDVGPRAHYVESVTHAAMRIALGHDDTVAASSAPDEA